ncbi:MAG: hypothetical protein ACREJM_11025 [Candidatus Saccharimonadales bacterium]
MLYFVRDKILPPLLTILLLICTSMVGAQSVVVEKARQFNVQGIELQSKGKLAEAAEEYRNAIRVYPSGAGAHNKWR